VTGLIEIRLLELPLVLRERSRQHGADLLREMELITAGAKAGMTALHAPARLVELAQELDDVYGPYVESTTEEMDAALDRGEETIAVAVYRLPVSGLDFVRHVAHILAEVEAYCQEGEHLLTLAAPPDIAAYREWSMSEVERQAAGAAPTPWPAFAAARGLV
jgi:hypothetical protein